VTVPAAYRYDWALFTDWCAAFDMDSLPAHPVTLARFLDAHPAADATQIRRVTAINSVHKKADLVTPGRAEAIRALLNPPAPTASQRAAVAEQVLRNMPAAGWPSGLFGRRDALILVLSCYADLPHSTISTLQRSDFTYEHNTVHIGAGLDIRLTIRPDPRTCPVAVYLRWARLQAFHDRHPSNLAVSHALAREEPLTADSPVNLRPLPGIRDELDGPIIIPFDLQGHFSLRRRDRRGVNPKMIGKIVTAHLSGTARIRPARVAEDPADIEDQPVEPTAPQISPEELERQYEMAIARRQRDAEDMRQLDDKYADIDARAAELLKRTEALLKQMSA
jgi:hypothetical protein